MLDEVVRSLLPYIRNPYGFYGVNLLSKEPPEDKRRLSRLWASSEILREFGRALIQVDPRLKTPVPALGTFETGTVPLDSLSLPLLKICRHPLQSASTLVN